MLSYICVNKWWVCLTDNHNILFCRLIYTSLPFCNSYIIHYQKMIQYSRITFYYIDTFQVLPVRYQGFTLHELLSANLVRWLDSLNWLWRVVSRNRLTSQFVFKFQFCSVKCLNLWKNLAKLPNILRAEPIFMEKLTWSEKQSDFVPFFWLDGIISKKGKIF